MQRNICSTQMDSGFLVFGSPGGCVRSHSPSFCWVIEVMSKFRPFVPSGPQVGGRYPGDRRRTSSGQTARQAGRSLLCQGGSDLDGGLNPDDQVGERKLRIVQDEISKIQEDTKKRENTRQPEVLPPQSSCRFCSGAPDTQSPTRAERCDGNGFRFVFFIVSLCTFRILVLVF